MHGEGDQNPKSEPSGAPATTGGYTYYTTAGTDSVADDAILTMEVPQQKKPEPAGASGQSHVSESSEVETVTDGLRVLQLGDIRGASNIESFFLRQLGTFKGEYNAEAISEWVSKVDLLKDILKASDAEIIRLLPLRLSTRALDFVRTFQSTKAQSDQTWKNLKDALLTQFGGKVEPTQLVNRLQQARMAPNTHVRDFGLLVSHLARTAYPELLSATDSVPQQNLQRSMFNRIALEQFVAGIPHLLSRPILENRITDFQTAVELAAHHEEINSRFLKSATIHAMHELVPTAPLEASAASGDPGSGSGGTSSGHRGPQGRPHRRSGPYNRRRPIECFRCHKTGHIKRECPEMFCCQICGERGHVMAQCTNIVCASCKESGHPANFCPKNAQSRVPTRRNTNC